MSSLRELGSPSFPEYVRAQGESVSRASPFNPGCFDLGNVRCHPHCRRSSRPLCLECSSYTSCRRRRSKFVPRHPGGACAHPPNAAARQEEAEQSEAVRPGGRRKRRGQPSPGARGLRASGRRSPWGARHVAGKSNQPDPENDGMLCTRAACTLPGLPGHHFCQQPPPLVAILP